MRWGTLLVLIIIAILVVFFVGKSRIPDMIANNLSKKLGVSVSIDSMSFGLSKIDVDKLEIGNPRGYSLPKAFSAEEIDLHAPITNYFKDEIHIKLIEVKDIYLGLEFDSPNSTDGNWTEIMRNLQKSGEFDEKGPEIYIEKIIFTNIQTDLLFRSQGGQAKKLPMIKKIELNNISTKGGFPTDQLANTILGQMLKEVFLQQNLNNMLQGILRDPGGTVDTLLKPFKDISNTSREEEKIKL